jgi:hypothetical protein
MVAKGRMLYEGPADNLVHWFSVDLPYRLPGKYCLLGQHCTLQ